MAKMKKPPPNTPDEGDRVCLRGNASATGLLSRVGQADWSWVDWDPGVKAPRIIHRYELMRTSGQSASLEDKP